MRVRCPHCHQLLEVADDATNAERGASPAEFQPTTRGTLWRRFLLGMLWLAMIASGLTLLNEGTLSGWPFSTMYAATICAALVTAGLALLWLTLWAKNDKARAGQFAISSLFFLVTFAALYFAGIRWVVDRIETRVQEVLPWNAIAMVAFGYTAVVLFSCPAVLGITEALMWLGVWLVRWPPARPLLKLLLRRRR